MVQDLSAYLAAVMSWQACCHRILATETGLPSELALWKLLPLPPGLMSLLFLRLDPARANIQVMLENCATLRPWEDSTAWSSFVC